MNTPVRQRPVPLAYLVIMGSMMLIALIAAGVSRITGPAQTVAPSVPVSVLDLRFEDRPDGSVAVFASHETQPFTTIAPATNGFLRATVRGLANQRKREDAGDVVPFRLTAWADGRLTLDDPATGRRVELEAFGPTNEAAFAALLTTRSGTP